MTVTEILRQEGGCQLVRRGRPLSTAGGVPLRVPVHSLALRIAEQLDAAGANAAPASVPAGRLASLALDRVRAAPHAFRQDVLAYAHADLLVHRAETPPDLAARQARRWDPLLAWARRALSARLQPTAGVMPQSQGTAACAALGAALDDLLPRENIEFALASVGELTVLSGSLVLALAVGRRRLSAAEAWALSTLEEDWQRERWGAEDEALRRQERRMGAFQIAADLLLALRESEREES